MIVEPPLESSHRRVKDSVASFEVAFGDLFPLKRLPSTKEEWNILGMKRHFDT